MRLLLLVIHNIVSGRVSDTNNVHDHDDNTDVPYRIAATAFATIAAELCRKLTAGIPTLVFHATLIIDAAMELAGMGAKPVAYAITPTVALTQVVTTAAVVITI